MKTEPGEGFYVPIPVVVTVAAPATHTRGVLTYATLAQSRQHLLLKAEDSARAAQAAGRPKSESLLSPPNFSVRLWANDLVALVKVMRRRSR